MYPTVLGTLFLFLAVSAQADVVLPKLSASCLEIAEAAGIDKATAQERFNTFARKTYQKAAVDCLANYPELNLFLSDWVKEFQRTTITCSRKTQKELDAGALSDMHGNITYPSDNFVKTVNSASGPTDWYYDTLIHEVLHSTRANNRFDHDDIEGKGPASNATCGDDIRADRVNVISALCSGAPLSGGKQNATGDLFNEMGKCGPARCVNLFEKDPSPSDLAEFFEKWGTPMGHLEKKDAESLCAKIYDVGACAWDLAKDGETITARKIPELDEVGKELRERFYLLFPYVPVQVSSQLLELRPEFKKRFKELESDSCFQKVFEKTPGESYVVRGAKRRPGMDPTPDTNFFDMIDAARDNLWAASCDVSARNRIEAALGGLGNSVRPAFATNAYLWRIKPRFLHEAEHDFDFVDPYGTLTELLGKPLLERYRATLKRFHYKSPEFDCAAAHLRPLQGMAGFQKLLNATALKRACR